MTDLVWLLLGVVVVAVPVFLAARPINRMAWQMERGMTLVSSSLIMFSMLFVSAEVFSRKLFNAPIPSHLELSELFLPPIIFLALAYTQSTGGHVRMTIFIDWLGPRSRHAAEIGALILSLGIYVVICYYSGKHAYRAWAVDDVTMSPPYFLIWPSTALVSFGIFFASLRLYLELIHLVFPQVLPASEPGLGAIGN